jgi:transcriptional regulator with XRE-family HTH domain
MSLVKKELNRALELKRKGISLENICREVDLEEEIIKYYLTETLKYRKTKSGTKKKRLNREVDWDVERAIRLKNNGFTFQQIGEKLKINPVVINRYFLDHIIDYKRCKPGSKIGERLIWTKEKVEQLAILKNDNNLSFRELGERMGVGSQRIWGLFKKYNVSSKRKVGKKINWDLSGAKELSLEKYPLIEISKRLKVPEHIIRNYFKEIGFDYYRGNRMKISYKNIYKKKLEGFSVKEIMVLYDISQMTVYRAIKRCKGNQNDNTA